MQPTEDPSSTATLEKVAPLVKSRKSWYPPAKFALEWFLAILAFILISPLLLFLMLVIKMTSRGPAIYSQTRLGKRGQIFRIYKLRTMVSDAESKTGPVWAAKDDRRITTFGRILRTTHLDELPQLWNVLKGEMSLVGPRPERPEIAADLAKSIPEFKQRLALRPGLTGLAQVLLPADDPDDVALKGLRRKLSHDLFYVREMNLRMDLKIMVGTACYMVAGLFDAIRFALGRSYGAMVEAHPILPDETDEFEQTV